MFIFCKTALNYCYWWLYVRLALLQIRSAKTFLDSVGLAIIGIQKMQETWCTVAAASILSLWIDQLFFWIGFLVACKKHTKDKKKIKKHTYKRQNKKHTYKRQSKKTHTKDKVKQRFVASICCCCMRNVRLCFVVFCFLCTYMETNYIACHV
jgi:hypothetical protein